MGKVRTSLRLLKTENNTGINPISLVKCVIPNRPFNCCNETMIADPPMNPISVGFDKKSTINPNLQSDVV